VGSDKVEKRIILYNDSDRFIDYFLFLKETATAFNTNLYPGLFYCSTRTNHQFPVEMKLAVVFSSTKTLILT
jgi:hypothetical protein